MGPSGRFTKTMYRPPKTPPARGPAPRGAGPSPLALPLWRPAVGPGSGRGRRVGPAPRPRRAAQGRLALGQLALHLRRVEAQYLGRGAHVPRGPERRVRDGKNPLALPDVDLDFGVHAGPEQSLPVVDPDENGEHRDVLLGLRLRLDLEHLSVERSVREGVHRHRGRLARLDLPDVGLVHQRAHLHEVEVGHLHQHGAAADVLGRRADDLTALDALFDDRPGDGGQYVGVVELVLRVLHRHLRPDFLRPGVGIVEQRGLVLLLGDGLRLVQLVRAALLRGGVGDAGLGHVEIGLRLCHGVARVARVYSDHQGAALHHLAGFHPQVQNLARRLRLHLDNGVGLDRAGGLRGDDDVPALDGERLVGDGGGSFLQAARSATGTSNLIPRERSDRGTLPAPPSSHSRARSLAALGMTYARTAVMTKVPFTAPPPSRSPAPPARP